MGARDDLKDPQIVIVSMTADLPMEALALLTSEPLVAHLATCSDGNPHSAPLWYRYDDGHIDIMTTGRKLENIKRNQKVSLSVQKDVAGHPRWRISLQGTAIIIEDQDETTERNRKLNRKYGAEPDVWLDENTLVQIDIGSIAVTEF